MENSFCEFREIDVSGHVEQKNGFNYLSWAWAWDEFAKRCPRANFRYVPDPDGLNYHTDGRTCWVEVEVTDGVKTITEHLAVMDYRNAAIPRDKVTSADVNKSLKRCLVKAIAFFGLGLYVYAGEDLPADAPDPEPAQRDVVRFICTSCGQIISPVSYNGEEYPVRRIEALSRQHYGRPLCWACMKKEKEVKNNAE